jgi:hypothetical protein
MSRPAESLNPEEQRQALRVLEYLRDIFKASPTKEFSRTHIINIITRVMHDASIFDPAISRQQDEAAEITDPPPAA